MKIKEIHDEKNNDFCRVWLLSHSSLPAQSQFLLPSSIVPLEMALPLSRQLSLLSPQPPWHHPIGTPRHSDVFSRKSRAPTPSPFNVKSLSIRLFDFVYPSSPSSIFLAELSHSGAVCLRHHWQLEIKTRERKSGT